MMQRHLWPNFCNLFVRTFPFLLLLLLRSSIVAASGFDLTLLHTNDVHARYMPYNVFGGRCTQFDRESNGGCFGGAARRLALVQKLRKEHQNVLLLDGGDQYQGTLWYTLLKWEPVAHVMNAIGYDAMAFGNHEFDDGLNGLIPFVKNLSFPVVNSNIDASGSPLDGLFKKNLILTVGGEKVGILGYTTVETPWLSSTGALKFHDEIESLRAGVKALQAQGVKHIIAVGHAGISVDRAICQNVAGVDIVVGGHTNTFLYTGHHPSTEEPEGSYPEVYKETGAPCLVVQDYAFGKYLGFLQVNFDANGIPKSWNGNPILLNDSFPEDETLHRKLESYQQKLLDFRSKVLTYSAVGIDGDRKSCRLGECNLANIITDAAAYAYLVRDKNRTEGAWTSASIVMMNGGGVRDFTSTSHYNITLEDIYTVLPFANTMEMIHIKAFEWSVRDYKEADAHGKFLQVSGVRIRYDLSKPNGQRVVSCQVRCTECDIPRFEPLDPEKIYKVVTSSYMISGGDGFSMIKDNMLATDNAELSDIDIATEYMKKFQPLATGIEGRITFVGKDHIFNGGCGLSGFGTGFGTKLVFLVFCQWLLLRVLVTRQATT